MVIYVSTSLHAEDKLIEQAKKWAVTIHGTFVAREKYTLVALLAVLHVPAMIIYTATGPEIVTPDGRHGFQLGIAELRIQNLRKGLPDHLIRAIGPDGPVRFLDCTCGFAGDSMVASYGLPAGSTVTGLEISPLLFAVTTWGLQHFQHKHADVTASLRCIHVENRDYVQYLSDPCMPPADIIYFDPMFVHPVAASPQFQPVRTIMDHRPLEKMHIDLALQKARKRVIIKSRGFRKLKEWYPSLVEAGGRYSRFGYAVLECSRE